MQNFYIFQKKSDLYIMVLSLYFGNLNNQCHFLIRNIYKLYILNKFNLFKYQNVIVDMHCIIA